jgi:hypothetical protein
MSVERSEVILAQTRNGALEGFLNPLAHFGIFIGGVLVRSIGKTLPPAEGTEDDKPVCVPWLDLRTLDILA